MSAATVQRLEQLVSLQLAAVRMEAYDLLLRYLDETDEVLAALSGADVAPGDADRVARAMRSLADGLAVPRDAAARELRAEPARGRVLDATG